MRTLLTILIVTIFSCSQTEKKSWTDWATLEGKFLAELDSFDSLAHFLTDNFQTDNYLFVDDNTLPTDAQGLAKKLGIKRILISKTECSNFDNKEQDRLTFQMDKIDSVKYLYVIYSSCVTNELKKNILQNGTYKELRPRWHLVQKNYDWFFE
ncbi:MAG: hypothetical protein KF763_16775 [Cyclobacteriaceae bacterium]|nr:hypothetical protein [Cyclobacteriaceae bacterium]